MLYFEGLTPSPCGHSPYLIYDEQRERIESITLTVFTPSEIYGDSPPPLCFAQQNIGEVARSDGGVEYHQKSIWLLFLTTYRGDRNVVADKGFIVNIQVCPHEFSTESVCSFCSAFALYYL